jgi:hypothetical protein
MKVEFVSINTVYFYQKWLRRFMKTSKYSLLLIGLLLFFSIIVPFFQSEPYHIALVNNFFAVGMLFLCLGAFLFIMEQGFFNGISYAFKRFRKNTKKGKYVSQFDDLDETKEIYEEYNVKRSYSITKPLLLVGGGSFLLSLVVSFLFFT